MNRRIRHLLKHILLKIRFGKKCIFDISSDIYLNSSFEGANKISHNCSFTGIMGYGSYIGHDCSMSAKIGRFTSIAPYVKTNLGVHPFKEPFATTCPMFYSIRKQNGYTFATHQMFKEDENQPEIGNDCWIGENVFIAGSCKIGDGAVVLAGSVIINDIPPYAVVGGVPAKIVKYRYDEDTINYLMSLKWWNKEHSWLKDNWELLCDIEKLKGTIRL